MKKTRPTSRKPKTDRSSLRFFAVLSLTVIAAVAIAYVNTGGLFTASAQKKPVPTRPDGKISPEASRQIAAMSNEKKSRTKAQNKIEPQLWYEIKMQRGEPVAAGVQRVRTNTEVDSQGKVEVDITANVSEKLIASLKGLGAEIINVVPKYRRIVARMPINTIERAAHRPDIIRIANKGKAMTNSEPMPSEPMFSARPMDDWRPGSLLFDQKDDLTDKKSRVRQFLKSQIGVLTGSVNAQSDVTHRSNLARTISGFNGAGITIGVLSDGVDTLAARQASGDLPATGPAGIQVLPGEAGSGDEGTAMLEIVHDVAPGAALRFATAFGGDASFAQNIEDLRTAGCDIIIDDVSYFDETPFQDGNGVAPGPVSTDNMGVVIEAVNTVTAAGALYFSSAGNSGNKSDNQSGAWEGDFVDGGAATGPLTGFGNVHDFGGDVLFNTVTVAPPSTSPVMLKWSDPLGASANDYDLFILDSTGTVLETGSTGTQDGDDDPVEGIGPVFLNERIVVVLSEGDPRFLHLNTNRGRLSINTTGTVYGHNAGRNTISVGATPAGPASFGVTGPFPFAHFTTNTVELFSSDGPRRIFFEADGTEITPGNVLATGGELLQKPDITAADGVSTTTPGFGTFFGTSAAAPQAGAMMALLKDASPASTNTQLVNAMTSSALDIEAAGTDRDSGAGIFMPLRAMSVLGVAGPASIDMGGPVTATEVAGNGSGFVDPAEVGGLSIRLDNLGLSDATNVNATLSTTTPGAFILPSPSRNYGTLAAGVGSGTSTPQFEFRTLWNFPCGAPINFTLTVNYDDNGNPQQQVFNFTISTGVATTGAPTVIATTLDTTAPASGPGFTAATGQQTGRLTRDGNASACGVAKASPGLFTASGARQFDSYTFTALGSGCVTVTLSSATGVNLFAAAYNSAGFVPATPGVNYLADAGGSLSGDIDFGFDVIAGQTYTIVVHEVAVGGALGANYTLTVTAPGAPFCQPFAPTAGEVSVEGRVISQTGRGISGARVTLTSPTGLTHQATTNSFGYYKITDVPAGNAYILNASAKRFTFNPTVLNITSDMTGVDIVASGP